MIYSIIILLSLTQIPETIVCTNYTETNIIKIEKYNNINKTYQLIGFIYKTPFKHIDNPFFTNSGGINLDFFFADQYVYKFHAYNIITKKIIHVNDIHHGVAVLANKNLNQLNIKLINL